MQPIFLGVDWIIIGTGAPSVKQQLGAGGGMITLEDVIPKRTEGSLPWQDRGVEMLRLRSGFASRLQRVGLIFQRCIQIEVAHPSSLMIDVSRSDG